MQEKNGHWNQKKIKNEKQLESNQPFAVANNYECEREGGRKQSKRKSATYMREDEPSPSSTKTNEDCARL